MRPARVVRFLLTLLIMLGAALALLQDRLLYLPDAVTPADALAAAGPLHLAPWPDASQPLGWLRDTPETTRGTVALFHGNAGLALDRHWYADSFGALGYRTLLVEYPGYGHRSGTTSEASFASDAAAILTRLIRTRRAGERLILAGESLGAGVAAAALAKLEPDAGVDAVLLITPWNDLPSLAAHHYLRSERVAALLLRDRYDTVTNLQSHPGPIVLLVAEHDEAIPPSLSQRLHDALPARKLWVGLPACGHNDWLMRMTPRHWATMLQFLESR